MQSNEGGMYPCSAKCIIKLIIKIMQTHVAMGTPFGRLKQFHVGKMTNYAEIFRGKCGKHTGLCGDFNS